MTIYAIIPARGGSKGVPGKNIKQLGGYPIIAYSILAAKMCHHIDRVVVSTDSEEIVEISKRFGADVPFLRPPELALDNSPDRDFVIHALNWFRDHDTEPDMLVHLRPTTPLRDPDKVDEAIVSLQSRADITALRSGHELPEPPHKMFTIKNGLFVGFFPDDPRPEYYNLPRQQLPSAYHPNGYVDILLTRQVRSRESLHGSAILPYITPHTVEIDNMNEFELLEYHLQQKSHLLLDILRRNFRSCLSLT